MKWRFHFFFIKESPWFKGEVERFCTLEIRLSIGTS